MSLIDESRRAFEQLLAMMPATVEFNGVSRPCVAQPLTIRRAQELQGYILDSAQQLTMDNDDFADFDGLTDRESILHVNGGEEMIFITKETHPNSAVTHLILASPN